MQTAMTRNELRQYGMRRVLEAIKQVKQEMPSRPLQRICSPNPEPSADANARQGQVASSQ
jgi:hypothetical protein